MNNIKAVFYAKRDFIDWKKGNIPDKDYNPLQLRREICLQQILLITGGTGSFGNAVLNRFLDTDIAEIRIFSRDEKKQDDMKNTTTQLNFILGDVETVKTLMMQQKASISYIMLQHLNKFHLVSLSHGGCQN